MHETLLDHQLVTDAGPGREERHPLVVGELLDAPVLGQVFFTGVLDIVVEREDRLRRIGDPFRSDGPELGHDRAGVVVGHDVERPHGDHVARSDFVSRWKPLRV
jgi:hypothetical protein